MQLFVVNKFSLKYEYMGHVRNHQSIVYKNVYHFYHFFCCGSEIMKTINNLSVPESLMNCRYQLTLRKYWQPTKQIHALQNPEIDMKKKNFITKLFCAFVLVNEMFH